VLSLQVEWRIAIYRPCLQGGPRQGPVKVGDVDHAQHDRAPVALQPDLAAHLAPYVERRQQRLRLLGLDHPARSRVRNITWRFFSRFFCQYTSRMGRVFSKEKLMEGIAKSGTLLHFEIWSCFSPCCSE